jgi:tRNA (mo5U34)-methyltransferase
VSDIEHYHVNVLNMTPDKYGQFDIVLALGLFYHVSDPYMALANCAALSRKRLLIESYCIDQQLPKKMASEPIMRFLPDPERFPKQGQPNTDRSNFWGFSSTCLQRMVEDIGFAVDRSNVREDRAFIDATRVEFDDAETRLDIAFGSRELIPVKGSADDPQAWTIF